MYKVLLLLAVSISVSLFARIGEMKVKAKTDKPKPSKGDIVCCEIFHVNTYNEIRVNKICVGKGKTVIEMEFIKDYSACTILQSNILIDEKGKQYSPTYHSGLANCPDLSTARSGHKFYWGFEALDKTAKVLKLKEDENMHPNMIPLQWTEINIEHCKW